MKKVLITGANGMIGSALTREFIEKYELILVDQFINRIERYKRKATIIKSNLMEVSEWQDVLNGIYCVVHLAAAVHWVPKTEKEQQHFILTNYEGTKMLYDACSKHRVNRFLFFSTNDVYRASDQLITEDTPIEPENVYGKSKLFAEKYLLEAMEERKTAVCIYRPASIYGENDKGSIRSLISFCQKGIVPMIGKGENKKALLYLKDIVQAVEIFIESKNSLNGEIFNISSGDYSYMEIINAICDTFKIKPLRIYIPSWFCKNVASNIRPIKKLKIAAETKTVSNNKAIKMLGYQWKYDLKLGLEDAKNYYTKC